MNLLRRAPGQCRQGQLHVRPDVSAKTGRHLPRKTAQISACLLDQLAFIERGGGKHDVSAAHDCLSEPLVAFVWIGKNNIECYCSCTHLVQIVYEQGISVAFVGPFAEVGPQILQGRGIDIDHQGVPEKMILRKQSRLRIER